MTSLPPKVSVLIPSYQHAAYIRGAVESVLNQTFSDWELIIIDDASKDQSFEILSVFSDPRIRLYRHEVTEGAHKTLNEALDLARGEFIAILNSDDLYEDDRLQILVAEALKTQRPDVFMFTDVAFMNGEGCPSKDHPRALQYQSLMKDSLGRSLQDGFLQGNLTVTTSNFFFSRSLFEKVGLFDGLRYTHDWDWALRALRYVQPDWIHEPLIRYRVHRSNTLSEDDLWRHIQENSLIQAKALMGLKAEASQDRLRERLSVLFHNESLHPAGLLVALLAYLEGLSDEAVSTLLLETKEGPGLIKALQLETETPEAVFYSTKRIGELAAAKKAQAELLEERFHIIESMKLEVLHRDEAIQGQAHLLEERFKIIEAMKLEVLHRDEALEGQARSLEERFKTIQEMSLEIAHRDEALAAQGKLLEERYDVMEAQGKLIEERHLAMEAMGREIASRDEAMGAQAKLLEGRFEAMNRMGDEIYQRDQALHDLQLKLRLSQKKPLTHLLKTIKRGYKE